MIKQKLKIFSFVCALLISISFLLPITYANAQTTSELTPIDMYLIAGQSNAVGYSTKGYSNLTETFDNVGYGGEVQRYFRTGQASSSKYLEFETFKWQIKAGLGSSAGYVGPEYGIAKVINDQYENRTDGRKAFIFKTAAGGTSLRDIDGAIGTTTGNYGNWYPRSLWESGYKPNTLTNVETNDATGYLYQLFIENFEIVYNELKENGYAPVVKGFVWMQGCQDLGYHVQYESLLKTFIADMKEDLINITGDGMINGMPFVIGKIATSFGEWNNPRVPDFNLAQQKVADDLGDTVATVETSDLVIVNQDGSYNGTDMYHFNCQDMQTLGERFGEKLLELNGKKFVGVSTQATGSIEYSFDADGKLTFTITPKTDGEKKYKLGKLLVNDIDVTESVVNNSYVIDLPENRTYAQAEFVELDKYNITYDINKEFVGVVKGARQVYINGNLELELGVKLGYKINSVTVNGQIINSNENGKFVYLIENVTEDLVIKVNGTKTQFYTGSDIGVPKDNKGLIIGLSCGGALIVGASITLVMLLNRKKKNKQGEQ